MKKVTNPTFFFVLFACSVLMISGISYKALFFQIQTPSNEIISTPDPIFINGDILKAICVITDFQNHSLEDFSSNFTGGVCSISDVQTILEKTSDHWKWLTCGMQTIQWNIIRIKVPQNLTKEAFTGWRDFRYQVVDFTYNQINQSMYDANYDGIIDVMWIISASRDYTPKRGYNYLIGGMAEINGAKTFLDGQGSLSLKLGAYANFNHEIGHCLALPDLYGAYDTIGYLSIMSDSWPISGFGFCAFDKYKLGWLEPLEITSTQKNIELLPAEQNFSSILIPTNQVDEYFLIEYRKKPESGYASFTDANHPQYNGLAIYHVDESQWNNGNRDATPLIRLEPADGGGENNTQPMTNDFWFPENPNSTGIFLVKSDYSDTVLFKVENIRWSEQGIRVDILQTENSSVISTTTTSTSTTQSTTTSFPLMPFLLSLLVIIIKKTRRKRLDI
ncbi:MAG: hypothetical protein ACFFBD_09035 [Candidatus Hodarchaeota archaeon]